jgi:hypothetical protein
MLPLVAQSSLCCDFCAAPAVYQQAAAACHWCAACAPHAITTSAQLRVLATWTLAQITGLGLRFTTQKTSVHLLSRSVFNARTGAPSAAGLAINWVRVEHSGQTTHQKAEIYALYGTPVARLMWVLAHELGHVIVSQANYRFGCAEQEEGFCQLLAYWVVSASKNPQASTVIRQEWDNLDPVYGAGLRREYTRCQAVGVQAYFAAFR